MELVKSEYSVSYSIKSGLVRSSASGNFQGRDYSPSVRITSENVYEVQNEKTNTTDDVKQEVTFKIICPDNATAGLVANSIKDKFKKDEILTIEGGFPREDTIAVSTPYEYFLFQTKPDKKDKTA